MWSVQNARGPGGLPRARAGRPGLVTQQHSASGSPKPRVMVTSDPN